MQHQKIFIQHPGVQGWFPHKCDLQAQRSEVSMETLGCKSGFQGTILSLTV